MKKNSRKDAETQKKGENSGLAAWREKISNIILLFNYTAYAPTSFLTPNLFMRFFYPLFWAERGAGIAKHPTKNGG